MENFVSELHASPNLFVLNPLAENNDIFDEITLLLGQAKSMATIAAYSDMRSIDNLSREHFFLSQEAAIGEARNLLIKLFDKIKKENK